MRIQKSADIGILIHKRRRSLGWSQAHLAALAGVGRQWVVEFEKGKSGAPMDMVIKVAAVLGYSLNLSSEVSAGVRIGSELVRSQPERNGDDDYSQGNEREVAPHLPVSLNSTDGRRERPASTVEPSPGGYRITAFETIGIAASPDQLYELENRPSLNRMVAHVISVEAPLFDDLLARRIAGAHQLARASSKLVEFIKEITEGKFARTAEDHRVIFWPEGADVRELMPFRPAPLNVRSHVDIPLIELASLATPLLADGHTPEAAAVIMGRQLRLGRILPKTLSRLIMAAKLAEQHPAP